MKNKLLLIMLVGCLAGIATAGTPIVNNNLIVDRNIGNIFASNTLFHTNVADLTNINYATSNTIQRDPCDNPPGPPPPNEADIDPSCVDNSTIDPSTPMHGTTHKDALPFTPGGSYVARIYKENPVTGAFAFVEEQPLLSFDGKSFTFSQPDSSRVTSNYVYYRVDVVVAQSLGGALSYGYFEVHYPNN